MLNDNYYKKDTSSVIRDSLLNPGLGSMSLRIDWAGHLFFHSALRLHEEIIWSR